LGPVLISVVTSKKLDSIFVVTEKNFTRIIRYICYVFRVKFLSKRTFSNLTLNIIFVLFTYRDWNTYPNKAMFICLHSRYTCEFLFPNVQNSLVQYHRSLPAYQELINILIYITKKICRKIYIFWLKSYKNKRFRKVRTIMPGPTFSM
jgi:hypothetical protein